MAGKIKFIIYLLYRYFANSKWENVAYFRSVLVILTFLLINILTLFSIMGREYLYFLPLLGDGDNKIMKFLKYGLYYLLPGYVFFLLVFKEKEIKNLKFDEDKITKGNTILITYMVLSVALFVISITVLRN